MEHKYNDPTNVPKEVAQAFADVNENLRRDYTFLRESGAITQSMPVGMVQWLHISEVQANDYNPNKVAHKEMHLLHTSVTADGYTQPIVALYDEEIGKAIIVDGFHRYTTMRVYEDVAARSWGYLPVVLIDKPIADRIASTVRHNRARGKHSVYGMSNLVFQMLTEGEDDLTICNKLGLDPDELARLKHITGYSKLFKDHEYSPLVLTKAQLMAKAKYKKEHPDEHIPEV